MESDPTLDSPSPQALETRSQEALEQKVALGMKVAVTDGARERLNEVLQQAQETTATFKPDSRTSSSTANMVVLRLNEDEIGNRTLPLIGKYAQVSMGCAWGGVCRCVGTRSATARRDCSLPGSMHR